MDLFKSTVAFVVVNVAIHNSIKWNKTILKIYDSSGKQQKAILVFQKCREKKEILKESK